jgi:SAM-dependent methyltransferase
VSDDEARRFMLEHGHYTEDLAFWRAAAARLGSPVLDLGAAAGRVAIDLARSGHTVWALDRSPDMLAEIGRRLRDEPPDVRERVTTVRGEMRALDLGRRFPLVVVAMNTLQVLTDPEDRLACLEGIRDHLDADGELIFDVALPDTREITGSMGVERSGGMHRDPATGATMIHSAWYDSWDPATQTLEFTLRVTERRPGGPEREALRHHRVHLFSPEELGELLTRAGLVPISVTGDFDGSPIGPYSERQIHRCRVAA